MLARPVPSALISGGHMGDKVPDFGALLWLEAHVCDSMPSAPFSTIIKWLPATEPFLLQGFPALRALGNVKVA